MVTLPVTVEPSRYGGYLYAYPHKSAYRPLPDRPALTDVWRDEDRSALALYVHIPFCEMRCGFCNLFTQSRPPDEQVRSYVRALERQATVVLDAVGPATYAEVAVGGGTPTLLEPSLLERVLALIARATGPAGRPLAWETSPATATRDRLRLLEDHGTTRISIGVQSFERAETVALARPQQPAQVAAALDAIRAECTAALNIDLIYGIDGQDQGSLRRSIRRALEWAPEEIYLYPLYVRPLTGLGRSARSWDDVRGELYDAGREELLAAGYRQRSMRSFVAPSLPTPRDHCCQDDGMVGLGCGARSYTAALHWSFDYAVSAGEVRGIVDRYLETPDHGFGHAEVGVHLDRHEQQRRYVIKSVLRVDGLDLGAYRSHFGTDPFEDLPTLTELVDRGWLARADEALTPTATGLAWSDAMGMLLRSPRVCALSSEFELR